MTKRTYTPKDVHMVCSHAWRSLKVFQGDGKLLFETSALTQGVGDYDDSGRQNLPNSDTPFGDYQFTGEIVQTREDESWGTWASYGPWFLGLYDLDGQERGVGRAGIGMHGGRQGAYAPDASAPHQLYPTHGCVRVYDEVLSAKIVPLVKKTLAAGGKAVLTVGP